MTPQHIGLLGVPLLGNKKATGKIGSFNLILNWQPVNTKITQPLVVPLVFSLYLPFLLL